MFGTGDLQLQRAHECAVPPPKGQPYGVPLPGSQVQGRSAVYRHWRFADKPLLDTLDPAIRTAHDGFEAAGTCHGHHTTSLPR